jgi:hypothetical protein
VEWNLSPGGEEGWRIAMAPGGPLFQVIKDVALLFRIREAKKKAIYDRYPDADSKLVGKVASQSTLHEVVPLRTKKDITSFTMFLVRLAGWLLLAYAIFNWWIMRDF